MPTVTVPAMPAEMPANFLGFQPFRLVGASHGRTSVLAAGWQPFIRKRLRHERRGLGACGKRGGTRGNAKSEFEKVTAFHIISLWYDLTMAEFRYNQMNAG
jgi:hypothetical protein